MRSDDSHNPDWPGFPVASRDDASRPRSNLYLPHQPIFHDPAYDYDVVLRLLDLALEDDGSLVGELLLESGATATLRLHRLGQGLYRLQLGDDGGAFPSRSPLLDPAFVPTPGQSRLVQSDHGWHLRTDDRYFYFGREPFVFRATNDRGESLFELERDTVQGRFVSPPLGWRTPKDFPDCRQAFMSWKLGNRDALFGLGEKWGPCEKTGTRAVVWASGTQHTTATDLAYKAVPALFSTAGWGLFLHTGHRSHWDIGATANSSGSVLLEDRRLDIFLLFGDSLADLTTRYTAVTGRPPMPPRWALGLWLSRAQFEGKAEVEDAIAGFRTRDLPLDVVNLDPLWMRHHYLPTLGVDACDFERNESSFPDLAGLFRHWRFLGVRTSLWVNPYVPEGTRLHHEAAGSGYLVRSQRGGLAAVPYAPGAALVDFTNPAAKAWWKEHAKRQLRDGAATLKCDYGEDVPDDALFHSGHSGREMHNVYPHLFAQTCFEATQEVHPPGFIWRRGGYLGSQRFPGARAGDVPVSWEGLRSALRGGLSAGFTGDAFWSGEIAGFGGAMPSPELYIRWLQLGLFCGLATFHGTTPREPWVYGERALEVARKYLRWRYRLIPYLLAMAREASETGLPLMRHLALASSQDPVAPHIDDQFLLGESLLVAPVVAPGQTRRPVYLPAGDWYPLEGGPLLVGGCHHTVDAPLDHIPIFVRGGTAVPLYPSAPPHLSDPAPKRLVLRAYGPPVERQWVIPDAGHTAIINISRTGPRGWEPRDIHVDWEIAT